MNYFPLNIRALIGVVLIALVGLIIARPTWCDWARAHSFIAGLGVFAGLVFHLFNTYEARPPRMR
jgi:hypothetical protein